jgi:hypothetical protein
MAVLHEAIVASFDWPSSRLTRPNCRKLWICNKLRLWTHPNGRSRIPEQAMELTPEQLLFLRAHEVPLSSVFDASGMTKPNYQRAMKEAGKSFAYGVSRCLNGHQSIRTRAGHCIQCDHARIAYMLRHDAQLTIYIAGSARGRLIKVGCSSDVQVRRELLNSYWYGGQFDWRILATASPPAAGRVECEVHAKLARFQAAGDYVQGGRRHKCYELFRCNFDDAVEALRASLPRGIELSIPDSSATSAFQFREH